MPRGSRIDMDAPDEDTLRTDSDFIIADGNVQTAQTGYGVVVSKGSRQYPHEPHDYERRPVQGDTGFLASDPGCKWCIGCAGWKPKERFNAALSGEFSPDGLHFLCASDQRRLEPKTLGLRHCSRCEEGGNDGWREPEAFGASGSLCREHEAERQRGWRSKQGKALQRTS